MKLQLTELDFFKLKDSFKEFLKSQSKFSDYDFDGSGLSILLDNLSYNSSLLAFYLNQVASESFLDSAILRENVVSRAKQIGYVPRSKRTAVAKVNINIEPALGPGDPAPANIFLDHLNTILYTKVDDIVYYFTPRESHTIIPIDGDYTIENVEVVEGQRLSFRWTVDDSQPLKQRFIIPNPDIDTQLLTVKVQTSVNDTSQEVYTLNNDINEVEADSTVYFLQEVDGEKFEVYFGDNVVGKKPVDGNIVIVEYLVTSGDIVNGANIFIAAQRIAGYQFSTITTLDPAADAYEEESIDSIKLLAPQNYEGQNRAVTKNDYETLLKKDFPNIDFIRVWGGEDNVPPMYGRVFISLKLKNRFTIPEDEKAFIAETYLKPRNIIAVVPVLVDPDFLRVVINANVKYTKKLTTLSSGAIQSKISSAVESFVANELVGFDSNFRYSKLISAIDSADSSISSNSTEILLKYRLTPPLDVPTRFDILLNNPIDQGDVENGISSVNSTGFIFRGIETFISDDGKGALYFYRRVLGQKVVISNNVGTIDYTTGRVILDSLEVDSIPDDLEYIDLTFIPNNKDITSLRNQILVVEDEDINISVVGI